MNLKCKLIFFIDWRHWELNWFSCSVWNELQKIFLHSKKVLHLILSHSIVARASELDHSKHQLIMIGIGIFQWFWWFGLSRHCDDRENWGQQQYEDMIVSWIDEDQYNNGSLWYEIFDDSEISNNEIIWELRKVLPGSKHWDQAHNLLKAMKDPGRFYTF